MQGGRDRLQGDTEGALRPGHRDSGAGLQVGTNLGHMAYTSAEARQELVDAFGEAIEQIGFALADLGAAYEQLDERNADRLEEELFGPVQRAYGRAKSAHARFADRHGLPTRAFEAPSAGIPSTGARGFIDGAVDAVARADGALSALRIHRCRRKSETWSCAPRSRGREALGDVRQRARDLERTLGASPSLDSSRWSWIPTSSESAASGRSESGLQGGARGGHARLPRLRCAHAAGGATDVAGGSTLVLVLRPRRPPPRLPLAGRADAPDEGRGARVRPTRPALVAHRAASPDAPGGRSLG